MLNSNRPINFLLAILTLIVVGCAETPTTPISYNTQPAVNVTQKEKQPGNLSGRLKTAATHKGTVWERLLSLYSLPEIENERVERQLNWYLDHPGYIARVQQRAEPYLHLILDEIEANNLPGELALLPIVESAFIPDAYSKADASGLWQFIPDTGRLYGLEQNAWYDGRRDILDSTQAATAFLKDLGETFDGDWLLALASYNWGKGNIWKAMEKNEMIGLSTDYWSLDMPRETADYVPRLLAIAKLFANADDYGIHLNTIPNKPYLEVVDLDGPLDLQIAAQLANMPFDKFMKLNPGFNRASTSSEGPQRLLLPVEKVDKFKTNLAQLPFEQRINQTKLAMEEEERSRHEVVHLARVERKAEKITVNHRSRNVITTSRYNVKRGDTLTAIAARNGTTVQALKKANPSLGKSVNYGVALVIPNGKKVETSTKVTKNSKAKSVQVQVASKSSKQNKMLTVASSSKSFKSPSKSNKSRLTVAKVDKKSITKNVATASKASSKKANTTKSNYRKANVALAHASRANGT